MKYQNVSKLVKNIKINGEFISIESMETIESPVKIHDLEMELISKEVVAVIEEPVAEEVMEKMSYTDIKDMKKSEQVKLLKGFGLEAKEIKTLNKEEDRIQKILVLQDANK